jgi:hypothetical protein
MLNTESNEKLHELELELGSVPNQLDLILSC